KSYLATLKRNLLRFCRRKRERGPRSSFPGWRRHVLTVECLEDRIVPSSDFVYNATSAGALTLKLANDQLQIVNTQNPSTVLAQQQLGTTGDVKIISSFNVALTIDASVPRLPVTFDATQSTSSTLIGPATFPNVVVSNVTAARSPAGDTLTLTT